jgi:hypothetical protein
MINLSPTFSSYAVDRRPIADLSYSELSVAEIGDLLASLYQSGFRRFVVSTYAAEVLWDDSQACAEWGEALLEFTGSCSHPVSIIARYDLVPSIDTPTGLIDHSFLNYEISGAFASGISGFLSHASGYGSEPYLECSHPHLRQMLGVFDNAHLWRDTTQDPYMSVSGACDLPEWYQAPAEVIDGLAPYSGWSSEPMRRNVEAVVVIPSNHANETNFSACSSWGFVPCLRVMPSGVGDSYGFIVDAYLSAEIKIKSTFARSKKIVLSTSGARRTCGEVPASQSFYASDARGIENIVCPANIDCSHYNYLSSGAPHLSGAACSVSPLFEDPLWTVDTGASVSGKLAHPSMFGSTGAAKAAEMALEIIAEEFSTHPDPSYIGELASVVVFSHWGRGGHADGVADASYEDCRLTAHANDAVSPLLTLRPLVDGRDTLYTANGISSCSLWMHEFITRFDTYRQRLAVFAGCSLPSPWMILVRSKLQVGIDNAVCNPVTFDGEVRYGNWAEQRADSRWSTEEIADFGSGHITASQFSLYGQEYSCTGYRPDGTFSRTFTTSDLQTDTSPIDPINNRPFTKWYSDLSRASAASALSRSIGVMSRLHFAGCAISCPDLVPGNSGSIVAREEGKPVFCQSQDRPFVAASISSTPSVFMAHVGMIAQGHPSLPPVPAGVRLLAKCSASGSQRPDWYTSSPIGDCSWEYGDQAVAFSYNFSSSSSSSASYQPSYQKSSSAAILSAPNIATSVQTDIHPMRDVYLSSILPSSEDA